VDESMLLRGVLGSVLGGRRKRSSRALRYLAGGRGGSLWSNPTVLLTAAGVAWGIYETLQQSNQPTSAGAASPNPAAASSLPPLPLVSTGPDRTTPASPDALRIVRLAISAANADGAVTEQERAAILEHARTAGVASIVERELAQPASLQTIVADVTDEAQRATLYVLAFAVVRGDEQPSGAERIYLAKLAHLLRLDPQAVQRLEQNAAERIVAGAEGPQTGD